VNGGSTAMPQARPLMEGDFLGLARACMDFPIALVADGLLGDHPDPDLERGRTALALS